MEIYDTAKERIDIANVAGNMLGMKITKRRTACPFHNGEDDNLHFYNETSYKCYVCGAHGDVFNLYTHIGICSPHNALKYINSFYNLGLDVDAPVNITELRAWKKKSERKKLLREWVDHSANMFCRYFRLLQEWRRDYAPKYPGDALDRRFVAALTESDYIDYVSNNIYIQSDYTTRLKFSLQHKPLITKVIQIVKEGDLPSEEKSA